MTETGMSLRTRMWNYLYNFGMATGVNNSYQCEALYSYHVNKYRVTRGNQDDFAPEWKSYRYFVSNPSDGHKGSQDILQVILHDQWTELYFHRSKTLFFKYLPKRAFIQAMLDTILAVRFFGILSAPAFQPPLQSTGDETAIWLQSGKFSSVRTRKRKWLR